MATLFWEYLKKCVGTHKVHGCTDMAIIPALLRVGQRHDNAPPRQVSNRYSSRLSNFQVRRISLVGHQQQLRVLVLSYRNGMREPYRSDERYLHDHFCQTRRHDPGAESHRQNSPNQSLTPARSRKLPPFRKMWLRTLKQLDRWMLRSVFHGSTDSL